MSSKTGDKAPLSPETLQLSVDECHSKNQTSAVHLIDPNSTEMREISTSMTELALSLSKWIMDSTNNPSSRHSMEKFNIISKRSEKFWNQQSCSTKSLNWEIMA